MKTVRIPIRNHDFEIEKAYLAEMSKKGWKLVKRGSFFYQFKEDKQKSAIYEIDILPVEHENSETPGWEKICSCKMGNPQFRIVYYYSTASDNRLLIDENIRMRYYEKKKLFYRSAEMVLFLLTLILASLYLASMLPNIIWLVVITILLILTVVMSRYDTTYKKAIKEVRFKLDEVVEIKARYFIILKKIPAETEQLAFTHLQNLGAVKQTGKGHFILDSFLSKLDVKHELLAVNGITGDNLQVTTPYDLWPMGMM